MTTWESGAVTMGDDWEKLDKLIVMLSHAANATGAALSLEPRAWAAQLDAEMAAMRRVREHIAAMRDGQGVGRE